MPQTGQKPPLQEDPLPTLPRRSLGPGKTKATASCDGVAFEVNDSFGVVQFGSSTWARTRDLRINSPALYRLSYRGMKPTIIDQIFRCLSAFRQADSTPNSRCSLELVVV